MGKIILVESPELTTTVQIVTRIFDDLNKVMCFEVIIHTITPYEETKTSKWLEVSNENQFPVWLDEDTPKLDENDNQETIGEWDMWILLKEAGFTMKQAEITLQESLQRAFGKINTPFKFILPQEEIN